jgi:hypothetical protein
VELWTLAFSPTPELPPFVMGSHDRSQEALGEFEVRFGYNYFFNGRDHLTPFAGLGVISLERRAYGSFIDGSKYEIIIYAVMGFLYDHEFNSVFNLGVNVKGFAGRGSRHTLFNIGSKAVGADVAIPITFRFGHKRHWDFRLEPFGIYIQGSRGSQTYYGARSTIGYRF